MISIAMFKMPEPSVWVPYTLKKRSPKRCRCSWSTPGPLSQRLSVTYLFDSYVSMRTSVAPNFKAFSMIIFNNINASLIDECKSVFWTFIENREFVSVFA